MDLRTANQQDYTINTIHITSKNLDPNTPLLIDCVDFSKEYIDSNHDTEYLTYTNIN